MVLAVLDTQEMMVDGRDLRRPLGADGEAGQMSVASIPLGRPASGTSSRPPVPRAGA